MDSSGAAPPDLQSLLDDEVMSNSLTWLLAEALGPCPSGQSLALYLYSQSAEHLVPVAARGPCGETLASLRFRPGDGLVGLAFRDRRAVIVTGDHVSPEAIAGPDLEARRLLHRFARVPGRPTEAVGIPLAMRDQHVGAALVLSSKGPGVALADAWLAHHLSAHVALAAQVIALQRMVDGQRQHLKQARRADLSLPEGSHLGASFHKSGVPAPPSFPWLIETAAVSETAAVWTAHRPLDSRLRGNDEAKGASDLRNDALS